MATHEEKSREFYSKLAKDRKNKTEVAGRYAFDQGKEKFIVTDIIHKLDLQNAGNLLDIGCGFGYVTESIIDYVTQINASASFMDIPEVIAAIKEDLAYKINDRLITFQQGLFPGDFQPKADGKGFDRILVYSVLHCTDQPRQLIENAVELLNPYGKLLLGDLPNISKKGRFLSSSKGRVFEADYRHLSIDDIPVYKDHFQYVEEVKNNPDYYSFIDDDFITELIIKYTRSGYDVFTLPQPAELPFSFTRQDLLICKYD